MTLNAQVDRAENVYLEWRINAPEQKYVSANCFRLFTYL